MSVFKGYMPRVLRPPGSLSMPKDGRQRVPSATSLELYFSVCVCLFLYAYFKMVRDCERRRKKGLVAFSFLKQQN